MISIKKEDAGWMRRTRLAGKLFNFIDSAVSRVLQHFKYIYVVILKVAHVVKLKLVFTDYLFYNLVLLIKFCKIRYLN